MLYSSHNQTRTNRLPYNSAALQQFLTNHRNRIANATDMQQSATPTNANSVSQSAAAASTEDNGSLARQNLERFRHSLRDYPQWDEERYLKATTRTFNHRVTDGENYKEALFDAARQHKPVVLMFGKSSDPATRQIVENSLKDCRDRSGSQAVFVFIDMDLVDIDSAPGRYAAGVTEKHGYPITICFTMMPGDAYNPAKSEVPSYHQVGPVTAEKLHESISRGRLMMAKREFPHVPLAEADRPKERVQPRLTVSRESVQILKPTIETARTIPESTKLIMEARSLQKEDKKMSYELHCRAITVADQSGDPALKSAARAELGIACIVWGFPQKGFAWLLDAGKCHADMYSNEKFADRLRHAGLPPATIQILLHEGQRNATWFEPNKEAAIERLRAAMRFVDHRPVPLELTALTQADIASPKSAEFNKPKPAPLAAIQLTGSDEPVRNAKGPTASTSTTETLPEMQLTRPQPAYTNGGSQVLPNPNRFASPFARR